MISKNKYINLAFVYLRATTNTPSQTDEDCGVESREYICDNTTQTTTKCFVYVLIYRVRDESAVTYERGGYQIATVHVWRTLRATLGRTVKRQPRNVSTAMGFLHQIE